MSTYYKWTQLSPSTNLDWSRSAWNQIATKPGDYAFVVGGSSCGSSTGRASKWLGTTWSNLGVPTPFTATPSSIRDGIALAYDVPRAKMVMFGGGETDSGSCSTPLCTARYTCYSDQTVTYDGSTFTLLTPAHAPSPRTFSLMAYCPAISKVVLFGGQNLGNDCLACGTVAGCVQTQGVFTDTWTWDGTDWTQIFPATSPTYLEVMATMGNNIYAWGRPGGGHPFDPPNTLWKFDGTNWSIVTTATAPGQRFGPGFAYWPSLGKIVMHGGQDTGPATYLSDTWTFDGTDFAPLATCAPPARYGMGLTEDPTHTYLLAEGGDNGSCFFPVGEQTWKLEAVTGPDATTGVGSGACSTATVAGTINAHGTSTDVYFDYGTTTSYGTSVFHSTQTGSSAVPVAIELTGLSPGTTYHFRVRAVQSCQTVNGADASWLQGVCANHPYLHAYVSLGAE